MVKNMPGFDSKVPWKRTDDNNTATNPLAYATTRYETWRKNDEIALNNISTNNSYTSSGTSSYTSGITSYYSGDSGDSSYSGGSGSSSTIKTVTNKKNNTLVSGTALKDNIDNYGSNVTIDVDAGNDVIWNFSDGSNTSINCGTGNDAVYNSGSQVTINGGAGKDYIWNFTGVKDTSVNAGIGNDTINNSGDNVTINAGAGNDYIFNGGAKNVTIDGGDGNDTVYNSNSNVKISGGDGDDSIVSTISNYVTVNGGAGNDIVSLRGFVNNGLVEYSAGDGNDTVYYFESNDTLSISASSYYTQTSGNDIIVTVGDGRITLVDAASLSALNIVHNSVSTKLPINNSVSYNSLIGGVDNDTIINTGHHSTISGGEGSDNISLGGSGYNVIQYAVGDGNDIIYNLGATDTLRTSVHKRLSKV